jgi:3-isopropylmalate/(R)-2-methylmalate dehydratase small subunit
MTRPLVRRGRAHVFGDDVSLDDGIIPARFAVQRITDPKALVPHLFESLDPTFAARVRPGDIILAGARFAGGKPRLQGLIALAALDLSVVCASMPFKILRRAVARAVPVSVGGPADPPDIAMTGDELEVDFATGAVRNFTRGTEAHLPAMPPVLAGIVAAGGAEAALRDWLVRHPEQALDPQK